MPLTAIFHGKSLGHHDGPFGLIQLADHGPHEVIPMHRHRLGYARLCIDGALLETSQEKDIQVAAGDVTNHPDACEHANVFARRGGRIASFMPSLALRQVYGIGHVKTTAPWVRSRWGKIADTATFGPALLVELCRHWAATQPDRAGHWGRIANELIGSGQTLGVIAERHGMSASAFSRRFSIEFGVSPERFRILTRVRRAIDQVVDTGCDWTTAAHASGFADSSHLVRSFRRTIGASPTMCL